MSRSKVAIYVGRFCGVLALLALNRRMDNAINRQTVCRDESATSFQRRHCAFALLYCRACRRVSAREELIDLAAHSIHMTVSPAAARVRWQVAVKMEIL